jgi:hypothetical protein
MSAKPDAEFSEPAQSSGPHPADNLVGLPGTRAVCAAAIPRKVVIRIASRCVL